MTLRAVAHLGDSANGLFGEWLEAVRRTGVDIDQVSDADTALDADIVFACGLLTALRIRSGAPLRVIAHPVFPGEHAPVYRSVLASRHGWIDGFAGPTCRVAINEYGSWSGWHGLKGASSRHWLSSSVISERVVTGSHSESIDSLLEGMSDVASIDVTVWNDQLATDDRLRDLTVFATTRDWPSPPVSIRSTLAQATADQLSTALLAVPELHPTDAKTFDFMLLEYDRV